MKIGDRGEMRVVFGIALIVLLPFLVTVFLVHLLRDVRNSLANRISGTGLVTPTF